MLSKRKNFFIAGLLLTTMSTPVNAGISASIRGKVVDKSTQKPIPNASVQIAGTTIGDEADANGNYVLSNLKAGTYYVKAFRIGYKERVEKVVLTIGESKTYNIHLLSTTLRLRSVEIRAERFSEKYLTKASQINVHRMRARDIRTIPGAFDDPLRAVQIFNGVAGGGDYSGYMAVRGGSPDQNQVIMDGVVIPSPYRFRLAFGAGLSSINPNTIQDIYLHLGGFSAEYGNSLSSILEVESKTGNRKEVRAQGTLNLTDANGIIESPLPFANGSFIFSVRRTYYDIFANSFSKSDSAFPFHFGVGSRVAFQIDGNNRIYVNFFRNREGTELLDELSDNLGITEDATTHLLSVSWRGSPSEKWQFDSSVSYYRDVMDYRAFNDSFAEEIVYESLSSRVVNLAFKGDIRYKIGGKSWLKWGLSATNIPSRINFESSRENFLYARVETPNAIGFDKSYRYYATYLESSSKALDNLHFRIGARYDYSTLINDGELSPRFNVWYRLSDHLTIEGSWGLFYQFPNPISVYTRNIPVDLSTNLDNISAEKATHQILGLERTFGDQFTAKLQLYDKDLDRLLLPIDEQTFAPTNGGSGFSRGLELVFEKKPESNSRFSGVLSYAFAKAKFHFTGSDTWLPFKYDRRHTFSLLSNMRISSRWQLSIAGQYSSGLPFTDVRGLRNNLDPGGTVSFDFVRGGRFERRLPAFKKIDARLSYQRRLGDKGFSFYLDVINITNQKNIQEITWERRYLPNNQLQATKRVIYMLPILPSIGVSIKM